MTGKHTNSQGFTLVEILVVVAIVAILVAIAIPLFLNHAKQAKISADKENIRSAKSAAIAEYLAKGCDGIQVFYFDGKTGKVTQNRGEANSFEGYGKSSEAVEGATGLPVKDGKSQILAVAVEPSTATAASWGSGSALDDFLARAIEVEKNFTGYHSGTDLINAMGTLPSVSAKDIFGSEKLQNGVSTLYWRPKTITINGVKNTVILYAGSQSTGQSAWQGFAIYYNGTIYRSTSRSSVGNINPNAINSIPGSFEDYVANPANHWEKQ